MLKEQFTHKWKFLHYADPKPIFSGTQKGEVGMDCTGFLFPCNWLELSSHKKDTTWETDQMWLSYLKICIFFTSWKLLTVRKKATTINRQKVPRFSTNKESHVGLKQVNNHQIVRKTSTGIVPLNGPSKILNKWKHCHCNPMRYSALFLQSSYVLYVASILPHGATHWPTDSP